MAGTNVGPHAAPVSNSQGLAEMEAATAAGLRASEERQSHYLANALGQGAQAGDPASADSTLQSFVPDVRAGKSTL